MRQWRLVVIALLVGVALGWIGYNFTEAMVHTGDDRHLGEVIRQNLSPASQAHWGATCSRLTDELYGGFSDKDANAFFEGCAGYTLDSVS